MTTTDPFSLSMCGHWCAHRYQSSGAWASSASSRCETRTPSTRRGCVAGAPFGSARGGMLPVAAYVAAELTVEEWLQQCSAKMGLCSARPRISGAWALLLQNTRQRSTAGFPARPRSTRQCANPAPNCHVCTSPFQLPRPSEHIFKMRQVCLLRRIGRVGSLGTAQRQETCRWHHARLGRRGRSGCQWRRAKIAQRGPMSAHGNASAPPSTAVSCSNSVPSFWRCRVPLGRREAVSKCPANDAAAAPPIQSRPWIPHWQAALTGARAPSPHPCAAAST
jgi:hypothetical protein